MASGSADSEPYSPFALRVVLVCSMAGTLMQALDSTIANVALPYMQGGLSASRDQVTWILTSYIVAAAIMTAPVGWISSRFGKKKFLLVCLTGFTVTSMMCGAAQSLGEMIAFRLLQGMFGAGLSPLSQSIMIDLYPPQKRGQIMAIWGMGVMLGPILGPTLGGYLTDTYSWRWVFYINLPFGIAAVSGILMFFKDTPRDSTLRFDWTGFAFLAVGLGAFQLMLDRGTSKGWFSSPEIIVEAIIAGLGLYLFLVQLFTAKSPFIPPKIFKDRNLVAALLIMFLLVGVMMASSALLPPYLQDLGGYSVTQAGILMAPRGLGTMVAMMVVGRIAHKVDARWLMIFGCGLLIWSMWDMSGWTPNVAFWTLFQTTLIQGVGMGFIFVPLQLVAFATLKQHFRTDASALLNLMRNIGGSIAISITTTVLTTSVQVNHAQLASHVTPFNRALSVNAPSMYWNPHLPFGLQQINSVIEHNAQVIAYTNDFLFMFFFSLVALVVIAFVKTPETIPKDDIIMME